MPSKKIPKNYQDFDVEEDGIIANESIVKYDSNANIKRPKITNGGFQINILKGKIGQIVVESVLNNFNYQTFAFGYEHIVNSTTLSKLDWKKEDDNTSKLRINPDILVLNEEKGLLMPVEVKSIFKNDRDKLNLTKVKFEMYRKNWPHAILAIFHYQTFKIYCEEFCKIEAIDSTKKIGEVEINYLGLKSLCHFFPEIKDEALNNYLNMISKEIFKVE